MQADLVGSQRCRGAADCHRNDNHEADQVLEQHDYRRRRELTCSFAQSAHQRDAEERQCGEDGTCGQVLGFVAGAGSGARQNLLLLLIDAAMIFTRAHLVNML